MLCYYNRPKFIEGVQHTNVEFKGGEGRISCEPVDYMLAYVEIDGEIEELYAEVEPCDSEDSDEISHDLLREQIIDQAKELGLTNAVLHFHWGDPVKF